MLRGPSNGICRRLLRSVLILLSTTIVLTGCSRGVGGDHPKDTIVFALSSEPKRLTPLFVSDLNSHTVSNLIFSGLTKLDRDLRVVGDLASSWEIKKGGRLIRFHLKKGVLWHDGRKFTAEDVVFTYDKITSPDTATPHSTRFGPVAGVRAVDPYTVDVAYSEPFGSALESWTVGIVPKHVLENGDIRDNSFDMMPVGTGPYRLKAWIPGQRLALEAFDRYHAGAPRIKNLVVKIVPDPSTRMLELKAGAIDIMEVSPTQFAKDLTSEFIVSHFNTYQAGSFRSGFLGFDLSDKRFQDKRLRQAISQAIDKEAIIATVLMGFGSKSTGPYPPETWYYSGKAKYFAYDPRRSLETLEGLGYIMGPDGLLQRDGMLLSFAILTNYENRENVKTAQIIQSNLKDIGIKTEVRLLEWQAFRHIAINKRQFEAVLLSRAYLWDPDIYDLWHSSKTAEGEWNFLQYRNGKADALLEKGRTTLPFEQRKRTYHKLHELLAEEQACIFLYNADLLFVANKKIRGIAPSPLGMLNNIEEWDLAR